LSLVPVEAPKLRQAVENNRGGSLLEAAIRGRHSEAYALEQADPCVSYEGQPGLGRGDDPCLVKSVRVRVGSGYGEGQSFADL
jgi:hypothetical protein